MGDICCLLPPRVFVLCCFLIYNAHASPFLYVQLYLGAGKGFWAFFSQPHWFPRGLPFPAGNKLHPGQFPKGVTEAGAETAESTPNPGKPSEMGLCADGISSSCPGCVSSDRWRFCFLGHLLSFQPWITLPPPPAVPALPPYPEAPWHGSFSKHFSSLISPLMNEWKLICFVLPSLSTGPRDVVRHFATNI